MAKTNLQHYLDEFVFRFNRRAARAEERRSGQAQILAILVSSRWPDEICP
jgi:hypothetical protein